MKKILLATLVLICTSGCFSKDLHKNRNVVPTETTTVTEVKKADVIPTDCGCKGVKSACICSPGECVCPVCEVK